MKSPTFLEQFDKITRAYFEDSLRPFSPCACFIGTMLNNTDDWDILRRYDLTKRRYSPITTNLFEPEYSFYTMEEVCRLEENFINLYMDKKGRSSENSLYKAMDSTLDMLQQIHESREEIIDQFNVFTKRQLQVA